MFGLSSVFSLKKSKNTSRFFRPRIDDLEARDCPAVTLSTLIQPGHMVQLTGTVTGSQVAGVTLMFGGATSGGTVTDSNGNYSYMPSYASLGTVTAYQLDQSWQPIASAQATIAVADPTLTLSIAYGSNNSVTLSGKMTDVDAGGRYVTISGASSGMTMTNSTGDFSFTTTPMNLGAIHASATNQWGQVANSTDITVTNNRPVIEDFVAIHNYGNLWTFQGRVTDESPMGLTVHFGGMPSLNGQTATVQGDGSFTSTRYLTDGETGTATASTTDYYGQASDLASASSGSSSSNSSTSQITLSALVQPGHMVQLTGSVTGSPVAGVVVMFNGAAYGSTTTDGSGNYTYTTSSASLGTVTAARMNEAWQTVASAQATITVAAPSLTLSLAYGSNRTVTLSGTLTDVDAAGRYVNLSGAACAMPITDSAGNFSLTTSMVSLGTVYATVSNTWGLSSNTPQVVVASTRPQIVGFAAIHEFGNIWTFTGRVVDEHAEGLTVRFGGLMTLTGLTATVDADGNFFLTRFLAERERGTVTAITADWWGLNSDEEWAAVL